MLRTGDDEMLLTMINANTQRDNQAMSFSYDCRDTASITGAGVERSGGGKRKRRLLLLIGK